MSRRRRWMAAAIFAGASIGFAQRTWATDPTAGPMIGHVTENSARLWMQFPIAGRLTVRAYNLQEDPTRRVADIQMTPGGQAPFTYDVPINGLKPSQSYRLEVKFDGQDVKMGPVVIQTCPPVGMVTPFTAAFGSGLALSPMQAEVREEAAGGAGGDAVNNLELAGPPAPPKRSMPIFKAITNLKPRAFLFLGDTGYLPATLEEFPDTRTPARDFISDFHSAIRREPDIQELLRTTACYGIYDDRDFGPVGADSHFIFGPESLVEFERYWPNPDWGTPQHAGCYSMFHFGDVDFFLLDARTFRDPGDAHKAGAMLGAAQLEWLEGRLKESRATFKVLAAPCALFGDDPAFPSTEGWAHFPEEQREFLGFVQKSGIGGVMALAGNQQAAQVTRMAEIPAAGGAAAAVKLAYPLYTLGCSTLAGPVGAARPEAPRNRLRVGGPVVGDTFGTLDFRGDDRDHRSVWLRIYDAAGKAQIEQVVFAGDLQGGAGGEEGAGR